MSKCDANCENDGRNTIGMHKMQVNVCDWHRKAVRRLAREHLIRMTNIIWDIEEQFLDAVENLKAKEG